MVVDGADPWEVRPDGAARSSWSRGVPAERGRGWPHSRVRSAARTRPWPPPHRPTYGRADGGSHAPGRWTRARGGLRFDGAQRGEAAAGANAAADLVGDGAAEGLSGLAAGVVAREARGSAGGVGWKSGRAPDASPPTPKRRAVSPTRRFPPLRGRESAAQTVRGGGEDGALRVAASHSHGGFGSEEGGLLDKVVAANGGASAADRYPRGHKGKSSYTSVGNAGLTEINGARGFFGTQSGQFGKKQLESLHAVGGSGALVAAHDNGSLAFGQSATQTVGAMKDALDGVVECQELEEGEIADTMEISIKSDALSKTMEGQELEEGEIAATMDAVEAMNMDFLDGPVDGQELEEGEIAPSATMFIVGVMNRDTLYGSSVEDLELEEGEIAPHVDTADAMNKDTLYGSSVEGLELGEGQIAPHMDTAEAMNEDTLYGSSAEGLELKEGEIAPHMDTAEAMNEDTIDEAIEVQELEEDEIAATMGIVESTNKESSDGKVEVQKLEEGVIAATIDIVESVNNQSLDGVVMVQQLEQTEIAAMDIVEGASKDSFVRTAEDRELEGEISAKGHDQEPDDGEIGTESDHIVQQPVNVVPRGSISGIMRSKIRITARKTVRPPVKVNHMSQLVPLDTPFFTTTATMKKFKAAETDTMKKFKEAEAKPVPTSLASTTMKKFKGAEAKPVPTSLASTTMKKFKAAETDSMKKFKAAEAKPVPISLASTTMKKFKAAEAEPVPISLTSASTIFTGTATMKKFKEAEAKPVPVSLASTSALASKEKWEFKYLFITKEELKGKKAVYLDGDDILKALVVHEGKLELCLSVGSVWRHMKHGGQNADPRSRVRTMCRRFEFLCRFLAQAVKQGSMQLRRVDLAADQVTKKLPDYTKRGSIVGEVAGVEVGDVFLFRVELAIVGLHSPYRAGIDTTKDTDGELIAVSIVASGGYLDEFSRSGELVYTGSGGKAAGNDQDGDQKLQRGNLALKNCIKRKIPVRVTHGFKSQNREEGSHSKGKEISKFIYDGLYHVVGFWQEGIPGSRVFKYRLRRISGQPELPLDVAKWLRKSVLHPC